VLGSEMDSPRGRIYLMRALDEGRAQITDTFSEHMFRCLDCRACETACPSGVHFGQMMEETRADIVRQRPAPCRSISVWACSPLCERRVY
jgi:glycolate oxidase iron-sulfur subunit